MTAELMKLGGFGSLSGFISSGASVLCVRSGNDGWPTNLSGQFRAFCDQELFILQGGSGPVFNILTRGAEGTVQMAHNDWAEVQPQITPQAALNLTGGVVDHSGATAYNFGDTDRAALLTFNASSTISTVFPTPSSSDTGAIGPHWWTAIANQGTNSLDLNPASGCLLNNISGATTLNPNDSALVFSTGSGYSAVLIGRTSGAIPVILSGMIGSGHIASGAVMGYFGPVRNIASGTVGVFDFGSGAVVAGTVGSGAIVSGNIASGQIGSTHLANNSVTNTNLRDSIGISVIGRSVNSTGDPGDIAAALGTKQVLMEDGAGNLLFDLVASGNIASGQIGHTLLSSGGILSGHLASGAFIVAAGVGISIAVTSPNVYTVTNTSGSFALTSGIIVSGLIGNAAVNSGNIASGQIWGMHLSSGVVQSGHIGNNTVVSGGIASGQIGRFHLSSGIVVSGVMASGAFVILAGAGITVAATTPNAFTVTNTSGSPATVGSLIDYTFTASETISGVGPLAVTPGVISGALTARMAMASVSGRMPAFGIITSNYLSGSAMTIYLAGQTNSTIFDFSGWQSQPLYVGSSGHVISSGAPTLSGNLQQILGVVTQNSGMLVNIGDPLEGVILQSGDIGSGAVLGSIASGYFNIASGTVGGPDLASGGIRSGHLASGAFVVAAGVGVSVAITSPNVYTVTNTSGSFALTSGIITSGLIGNGAVVSGSIASGQIGRFHLSSGIVVSGVMSSGAFAILAGTGITVAATAPNVYTVTNASGSFALTSGIIVSGLIGNNAVNSGNISSGAIGSPHIASGQVQTYHHTSGSTSPLTMGLLFYSSSGEMYTAVTEELISGVKAVHVSQSGYLRIAMASVSGRYPALGIVIDNVASGLRAPVYGIGAMQIPLTGASGVVDFSGYLGRQLVLGRSGHVVVESGGFNSGGLIQASGDVVQSLGSVGINSGRIDLNVEDPPLFNQIVSGNIASGQINRFHLSSGIVVSGVMASGAFVVAAGVGITVAATTPNVYTVTNASGSFALTSGIIVSGMIGNGAVVSGSIASGQIGGMHLSSGAVVSGHLGDNSVVSGSIASGQINRFHLSSGIVVSGIMASGAFAVIAGAGISVAATAPNTFTITNTSGAGGGVGTGGIASGVANFFSGNGIITSEVISGLRAVSLTQSGYLQIAKASVSGTMPAIGIVTDNVASGIQTNVYPLGQFQFASGLVDFSGYLGRDLYVGRSGQLVTASGAWNSGGFFLSSGDIIQILGTAGPNSGAIVLDVADALALNQVVSGNVASGQINRFHLSSGIVISGVMSSGAFAVIAGVGITVAATSPNSFTVTNASGSFALTSGIIVSGLIGNGSVTSGNIASGQIGQMHLSSGAVSSGQIANSTVVSGSIASGQIGHTLLASGGILSGHLASGAFVVLGGAGISVAITTTNSYTVTNTSGSFALTSGIIVSGLIGNDAVNSGNISSGQISQMHIANGGVLSGNIGSGQIAAVHIQSGTILPGPGISVTPGLSGILISNVSGASAIPLVTEEDISGVRAVNISQSGYLRIAMASVSGRMPAVGILIDNVASGATGNFYSFGKFQFTSGLVDFTGSLGQTIYVGRSGHLVPTSGSWNSGGFIVGDIFQTLGYPFNSGGLVMV